MKRLVEASGEALWGVLARPKQLLGAGLAAGLGIALFVATWTVSVTAQRQVADTFDALRATEVRVLGTRTDDSTAWVPSDYDSRLRQLPAVVAVEHLVDFGEEIVSDSSPDRPDLGPGLTARIWSVDLNGPKAMRAVVEGGHLDDAASQMHTRMVLIGGRLAAEMGIDVADGVRAIWIGESPFVVRGLIRDAPLRPELLDAVVVLHQDALAIGLSPTAAELVIETAAGGANSVATQAPLAIRPESPNELTAVAPPDPGQFRRRIEDDTRVALLAVSGIAVLVGAMALSNAIALSVIARTPEIGLRRALGARSLDVFATVIAEATIIGLIGGIVGSSLGIAGAIGVAAWLGWNPIAVPLAPVLGTGAGVVIGVIAGVLPGIRATRIEPVAALRSSG